MRTRAIVLFGIGVGLSAFGQERFGITHSNYAGADAIYLNPSRSAGQWPYLDVRLAGVDVNAWNSLVAWSNRDQPLIGEVRSGINSGSTNGVTVLRDASSRGMHRGVLHANVLGPSFSLSLGRGTIGAGIRSRIHTSVTQASSEIGNFIFYGWAYRPQHGLRYGEKDLRVQAAAWTEFAVNYGHILRAQGFDLFSAGINAKYNLGHAGALFRLDELSYTVLDTTQIMAHNVTGSYGFAMPALDTGRGWGVDAGVTYERGMDEVDGYLPHRASGGCDASGYRYRIGLSVIDLGRVRFAGGTAGSVSSGSINLYNYTNAPISDQDDLDSLLSTTTNWERDNGFELGTPTALALQYDQRAAEHVYIALAAVQQMSGRNSTRLRRANSIAITPRFETKHVEVALPLVLHEYDVRHPSVGFMVRVEGLVIGSDHIMPFFDRRDVHAADLYFRLRFMLHRSPFCKGKRNPKAVHRTGSSEPLPCATPNE